MSDAYNPDTKDQRAIVEAMLNRHKHQHFEIEMQIATLEPQKAKDVVAELKNLRETRDNFRRAIDVLKKQLAAMPAEEEPTPPGD